MTDLHQTLFKSCVLLIIVDKQKYHLDENITGQKILSSEYLKSELNITFSKILEQC